MYSGWIKKIDVDFVVHRKLWEWGYIAQVLYERGMLVPDKRGLGFAVGKEQLVSLFAKHGVKILATDIGVDHTAAAVWVDTNAHSSTLTDLFYPNVCDNETFFDNVQFQPLDMNNIPDDLSGFDFCWSSSAFEHLGTVDKGREFVLNSLKVLKPGGISVHTTDYNITSDFNVDIPHMAVFGRSFFEQLRNETEKMGHTFLPFDLRLGNSPADDCVYWEGEDEYRMKQLLAGYITTSISLVIRITGRSSSKVIIIKTLNISILQIHNLMWL